MSESSKIKIGVGACLMGQNVRYNASHKKPNDIVEALKAHVDFVAICPEVGIGLGVPRETIRIVTIDGDDRLRDSKTQTKDYTESMANFSVTIKPKIEQLCGYIFIKGSPSCGVNKVNRYGSGGEFNDNDGMGIFAKQVKQAFPLLPIEDDNRLHNPQFRENFVARVYVFSEWQQLLKSGVTHKALIDFWSRHKYIVMSRHYESYKQIGRLLANRSKLAVEEIADQMIHKVMFGLRQAPTRKGHTNVLQHLKGYLKRQLSQEQSRDIDAKIVQYRNNIVPLVVPLSLLKHQFSMLNNSYINQQSFINLYPQELGLHNHI